MSTSVRRAILGIGALLLLLFLGGLYFLFRVQENTRTASPARSGITSLPHLSPTATLQTLFSDNFSDNSQNWDVGSGSGYASTISNGSLTMTETNHKTFREPLPTNAIYNDFMVTVPFTLLKGDQSDSVGLSLRATEDTGQGYYIDIDGDSDYDIAKAAKGGTSQTHYLVEPTSSSALHPKGQENSLTVIMKGSDIVLLLNGSVVKAAHDSQFTSGKMALFVENGSSSNGVTASFGSIAVYAAPDRLPT